MNTSDIRKLKSYVCIVTKQWNVGLLCAPSDITKLSYTV